MSTACPKAGDRQALPQSWRPQHSAPACCCTWGCLASVPKWTVPARVGQTCPPLGREIPAGTQSTATWGHRTLPHGDTGLCCAGTKGTAVQGHRTHSLLTSLPMSSLPPQQEELLSAGELAALAPAALHNQEIAVHKRQLTHLFLNQLLFTPSSVPLAVPLSVPLAADCPLSPARPCSLAPQPAGPGRSRGTPVVWFCPPLPMNPQFPAEEDAVAFPVPGFKWTPGDEISAGCWLWPHVDAGPSGRCPDSL